MTSFGIVSTRVRIELEPLKPRLVAMADKFEAATAHVKETQDQETLDLAARLAERPRERAAEKIVRIIEEACAQNK